MKEIENIELSFLNPDDYDKFKEAMIESYSMMPEAYWKVKQVQTLIDKFPEGQAVIKTTHFTMWDICVSATAQSKDMKNCM